MTDPQTTLGWRICETDNHGSDYPNEKFLCLSPSMNKAQAQKIADAINNVFCTGDHAPRYWKVVPEDYKLQPGFEP